MGCCTSAGNPIFAKYIVGEKLGQGTFAMVRKLENKRDPSDLKALKITSLRNLKPDEVASLKNEVTILGSIEHPHIVKLYEHYETQDKIFMVQDLLNGGELFDRIIEQTFFSEKEAARVVKQIASALLYLHELNIVHRDLKPENLLLTDKSKEHYDIKIIDFGLAKRSADKMEMPCGTPGYVAPEILKRRKYHKEVDVWSLGVITYILLCGFPPFVDDGNNLKSLYKQIRKGNYTFPDKYWKNISDDAKKLISRMLEVKVHKRYTAQQVFDDPWTNTTAPGGVLQGHFIDALRRHQTVEKLRRGVQVIMALKKLQHLFEARSPQNTA